jgi:hypothetical protein
MKMAELLRQLADKIDSIEQDKPAMLAPQDTQEPEDDSPEEVGKFMAPNQQKLELLKKGVGVKSEFDDEGDAELDAVKRNAGISPAVVHIASDDDPLE